MSMVGLRIYSSDEMDFFRGMTAHSLVTYNVRPRLIFVDEE